MAEKTGRYRVAIQTVTGWNWRDMYSLSSAIEEAKKQKRAGAFQVEVMEEYESDDRFAADFRRIWP